MLMDIPAPVAVLFWTCVALVLYAYAGYPLLVALFARVFGRDESARELADAALPRLSVLVAAHNEREVIGDRVRNLLEMDYPADRLEIVIASDGSDDGTVEVVRRIDDPRVRVLDYTRRGKSAVLNAAFQELTG